MALEAIAEEGSIASAARRLGYTQPGVRQQIAALERALGTPLLTSRRGSQGTRLTAAGQRLLPHARAVIARIEVAAIDTRTERERRPVALGVIPSVAARLVAPALKRLRTNHEPFEFRLVESASDLELLRELERGRLDLAFSLLPVRDGPFSFKKLIDDPYVLIRGKPRSRHKRSMTVEQISKFDLIEFRRSEERVAGWLRQHGLAANIVARSDDNATVTALVAAGVGAAVVPALTVDPRANVVVDHLRGLPPRQIAIVWHVAQAPSGAAALLLRELESEARACRPPGSEA